MTKMRFRKKPEIVVASQTGADTWVVANPDGTETTYPGAVFREKFERVTDHYQVHPLQIDASPRSSDG